MKKPVGILLSVIAALTMVGVSSGLWLGGRAAAQAVAQSFTAESPLQPGMVVQLGADKSKVKPVVQTDASKMFGVVVQSNDAPLSLTTNSAGDQVYIATSGSYRILTSDQNGAVKKGDYIVISAIDGIAMKVNDTSQYVVGKALGDFDGTNGVLSSSNLKDSAGTTHTIHIGYVNADINISRNPLLRSSANTASNVPGFLLRASESIANKAVSPAKVYISLAVALLTALIVCTVLYAGIRNSIIALGRNPLARRSIYRNLFQVLVIGLIILVTGFFAVYLLLKL